MAISEDSARVAASFEPELALYLIIMATRLTAARSRHKCPLGIDGKLWLKFVTIGTAPRHTVMRARRPLQRVDQKGFEVMSILIVNNMEPITSNQPLPSSSGLNSFEG